MRQPAWEVINTAVGVLTILGNGLTPFNHAECWFPWSEGWWAAYAYIML